VCILYGEKFPFAFVDQYVMLLKISVTSLVMPLNAA